MLVEGLPLWLAATNAWIVSAQGPGGECVLVDAPPEPGPIVDRLNENGLRLVALLNTHGHVDHVGGVTEVVKAQDHPVPVRLHEADRFMLDDPVGSSGAFGALLAQAGLDTSPPELVQGITDGERISGAGMTFTALHTPGHTEGSTCFLLGVDGHQPLLFSGDHLFKGSIGRTDLPGGSFEALMESMADKILPLDDGIAVLPGHGGSTTIGQERRTNPFVLELRRQLGERLG